MACQEEAFFGLNGMAWNVGIRIWPDWNSFELGSRFWLDWNKGCARLVISLSITVTIFPTTLT
jgi:hypothetical protein